MITWLKERSHFYDIKGQVEAVNADVEAAASYPANLVKVINEGSYIKKTFSHPDVWSNVILDVSLKVSWIRVTFKPAA